MSEKVVVPSLDDANVNTTNEKNVNVNVTSNLTEELSGKQYVDLNDFIFDCKPVPKLWKSRNKILTVKPMTKGDRDDVLKPINGQRIEAQADGTTKGFWISLDLFDQIKKGVIVKSLSHYIGPTGKPTITIETLGNMDNSSYEELSELCLSVNKIDFFEGKTSDVAAASEIKN